MRTPVEQIECFHLVFLRLLESRLDRASWVVKGGVNLRAWFGSLRYSEDLDIDVVRGSVHRLTEKVDKLLASVAFHDLLAAQGLTLVRTSQPSTKGRPTAVGSVAPKARANPKQTETTQRWKFEIRSGDAPVPLHTRVEFSRRGSAEEYVLEPVRPQIVRPYGLPAPTANHYTARSAVRQKIQALSDRAETQARDIWDLEHLLRTTDADPRPLTPRLQKALTAAVERTLALPYDVFKGQVVPYLASEYQELYGTREAWARICELVVDRLTEIAG